MGQQALAPRVEAAGRLPEPGDNLALEERGILDHRVVVRPHEHHAGRAVHQHGHQAVPQHPDLRGQPLHLGGAVVHLVEEDVDGHQLPLDPVHRGSRHRAPADGDAALAHEAGELLVALDVRHRPRVLEQIAERRVVGRALERALLDVADADARRPHRVVVDGHRPERAVRRLVADDGAVAVAADGAAHALEDDADGDGPQVPDAEGAVRVVVGVPEVLEVGDDAMVVPAEVVDRLAQRRVAVLRRQRASPFVRSVPEVESRRPGHPVGRLASDRREHPLPARHATPPYHSPSSSGSGPLLAPQYSASPMALPARRRPTRGRA